MRTKTTVSAVQLSLFPQEETSVKDTRMSCPAAHVTNYLHTREGLWRLLATYPPTMPLVEALQHAHNDFTRCKKGGRA